MATSTRFAVGAHLLTALAVNPGKVLRSEDVADSANTNPVVVRRLFSLMTTAGLIRARLGPGGGFELARPASDITLRDVFAALESGRALHRAPVAAERVVSGRSSYPSCSARGYRARGRGPGGGAFAHYDCRYRQHSAYPQQRDAG
jgi:DNA-binding IscR family transcriptional regulator